MKCVDCVYCGVEDFMRVEVSAGVDGARVEEKVAARESVCRFYPPSGTTRVKPIWPVVDRECDWCGRGVGADGKVFVAGCGAVE